MKKVARVIAVPLLVLAMVIHSFASSPGIMILLQRPLQAIKTER